MIMVWGRSVINLEIMESYTKINELIQKVGNDTIWMILFDRLVNWWLLCYL